VLVLAEVVERRKENGRRTRNRRESKLRGLLEKMRGG